ncbi:hypothetical protein BST97_14985 [Nonlabens spongiae]|uniref:DUF2851 domain-containing protein n=1 Tax=Nonlabens spongiae TaxID=331648 RepID=A0A1W6MNK4_9FLAO|nr:DUF2851 family protein [Nonlabens spongiae]ARN79184.1 hypothetical protein BST97_14985 [Nonlabens spongiae]
MREDFIHYLWKFKKLNGLELLTTTGKRIVIKSLGQHNHHSGPDFFNGRLSIDGQEWAGNIEMHLKASDWFLHGHDDDPAYNNVILHVVWTHDADIATRDGLKIPVLEVSRYVDPDLLKSYQNLFKVKQQQFINCENSIPQINPFKISQWKEKLFIERLEQKSLRISKLLERNTGDWEATFLQLLARSFGTKVNADAFEQTARSMAPSVVRKLAKDAFQLESTLLGQAGLLEKDTEDQYMVDCRREYAFAKAKHSLKPIDTAMKFFRIRPVNYPTIRLSQLARLYHFNPLLFGEVLLCKNLDELYDLFNVKASSYWDDHHVFGKQSKNREKYLSRDFVDLLIINCVVPIKFAYAQYEGKDNVEDLMELLSVLKPENNTIVEGFMRLITVDNAVDSQAVLQLKPNYCDVNKCLSCDIGVGLLRG